MDRHFILQSTTLFNALEKLNILSGEVMTLLVVDAAGRLTGTLTDGDVRRALLRGESLQAKVADVMHRTFRYLRQDCVDVSEMKRIRGEGIALVPVVDADGRVTRVIDTRRTSTLLPLSAVLMAGGRGERLRPLTLEVPKPLLPVGGKPIIDHNVAMLAASGITDICVTVNYMAEKIEEHFARPVEGVYVKTVREPMFMGTIGSVALTGARDPGGNTLVMNSDLLTSVSLEEMWLRHCAEKADITIASIPYNVSVPYAVLSTSGQRVTALVEKPSMSYYANAGIYIMSNRLLNTLPAEGHTDATDLIERAIADGLRVTYFPVDGTWIDIGTPADYAHACDLMALKGK